MLKKILKYRLVSILAALSLLFVLGGFFWAYAVLRNVGPGPFILHFNDIDGITQLGGLGDLAFVGVLGVVIVLANFNLALELEARDRFLGKAAAVLTLTFSVLLFIAFAAILNVN